MVDEVPCIEVGRAVRQQPRGAAAAEAAAREALAAIRVHQPSAALVFASVQHDLGDVLRGVRRALGDVVPVIGSSTAGEICDGVHHGSVVVSVLASPHLSVRVALGENVSRDWSAAVGAALDHPAVRSFFDGSAGEWQRLTQEGKAAFAFLLSPGDTRFAETRSYEILETLKRRTLGRLPVFGLSAADDLRFDGNYVGAGDRALRDGVVVAVFETRLRFGIALAHGMHPCGRPLKATASNECEVLELDHKPAADAYAELMGLPRSALDGGYVSQVTRTLTGSPGPLGAYLPNAAAFVTPRGGIRFAIPVAPGSILYRLAPVAGAEADAGREAAAKAIVRAGTSRPAVAIASCCALRPVLLGDAFATEIPRMSQALNGAPLVGFFSYGEQGLSDEGVPQHTTAVIGALVLGNELSQSAQVAFENQELRRRGDALRKQAREELERQVADRTAELQAANARLQAEIEARQRNQRAWRTLSLCNEAVVRATGEPTLFRDVCRILVEVGGYRMVWVGLAAPDGFIRPVAHAGFEEGFLGEHRFCWSGSDERGDAPCGTAIRSGKPVLVRDLKTAPGVDAWREGALRRGYASVATLPLSAEGRSFGAVVIYASDAGALDEAEMALLSDLAGDLSFGVSALRVRAERSRMTTQLMQADRLVAMGTLAAGVGHEINNPLAYSSSGVKALAELVAGGLREPAQVDEAQGILREIGQGLERIRQAVRDLKLFSRGDDDTRRPVEIEAVLESTLHMAQNDIRHRARLVRDYGPAPRIAANESRLGQVFLNLIVNASQSIPDGAADVNEIRVSTWTDRRGWAAIEIRDTGGGISAEDLARIFEPFFTTKPRGEGTGLGLAICRNIVESLDGEITVESDPGKGSTFRVFLPPVESERRGDGELTGAVAPGTRRGRVLVLDDDALVARSMKRMLAREHDVVVETSARVALRRFQAGETFDVVVCDVMMPQMSGPEFHTELGRIAPDQASRVVFVTGGAFTAGAAAYLEKAGCRMLEKPFEAEALRELVRELL